MAVDRKPTVPPSESQEILDLRKLVEVQRSELRIRARELKARDRKIETRDRELAQREEELEKLKRVLLKFQRMLFGRKTEQLDPNQLQLHFDNEPDPAPPPFLAEAPDDESESLVKEHRRAKKGHGRKKIPDNIPRIRQEQEPPPEALLCECCQVATRRIGEEVTEVLEFIPASFVVLEKVRPKFACPNCEALTRTPPPELPILKGRPGPGLLAEILVRKYSDHLPLARQCGIFEREGVEISRSTMCDWIAESARLLKPVVDALIEELLAHKVVQLDHTAIKIRDPSRPRPKIREGRIYTYTGPPGVICFAIARSKQGKWPKLFLKDYKGYVQGDADPAFDVIYVDGTRLEVGCWAHARRRFYEVKDECPEALGILVMIGRLYQIEREAKELSSEERRAMRQEKSAPVVAELMKGLRQLRTTLRPSHPLMDGVVYATNQEQALQRYLEDGDLDIDNNRSERQLKLVALGRKNWLFAGSQEGAERSAVIYSLIASCKELGISPSEYLRDVLDRLPTTPVSEVIDLTPTQWKVKRD